MCFHVAPPASANLLSCFSSSASERSHAAQTETGREGQKKTAHDKRTSDHLESDLKAESVIGIEVSDGQITTG